MPGINKIFAKRMKRIRIEKGKTLDNIHDSTGIAKSTLSRYENANSAPAASILVELAKYFNVSADYLLGLTEQRRPYDSNKDDEFKKVLDQAREDNISAKELRTIISLYPQLKTIIENIEGE